MASHRYRASTSRTYAPVGRLTSLQVLLALSANHDLELSQADVEGAYLNGKS